MTSRTRAVVSAAVGVAALAGGVLLLVFLGGSRHVPAPTANVVLNAIIVWSFVFAGLVAWNRRPGNRTGPLMMLAGLTWFLSALQLDDGKVLFTIGLTTSLLPLGAITHLVLSFPGGRLATRPARLATAVAYVDAVVFQLAWVLLFDPTRSGTCEQCPVNALLVTRNDSAAQALQRTVNGIAIVAALAALAILIARWRQASGPARRSTAPVLLAGAVASLVAVALFASSVTDSAATTPARLATFAAIALVPLTFLVSLLRSRLAQGAVTRLVVELTGGTAPGRVRESIARALSDPSLELAYWTRSGCCYVDVDGRPLSLPDGTGSRVATVVERDGHTVGALIHDASLREQPGLVNAVAAAAGLALENERLAAELKASLDNLRASEERLRALIEASPLSIVELDLDGVVTFWNGAAERLYGWTAGEAVGQQVSFVPDTRLAERDELLARLLRGESVDLETTRLRKDGTSVEVALSAAPVYDGTGRVVRSMAVTADVTERKRAVEELRRERDFISALIDSTACLVVVLDREGRFVRFNRACERLSGYGADEVLGRPFWELFIEPDEVEPIRSALEQVWAGDFPADNENHWTVRDGSRRLIAWSNTALLDAAGNVQWLVSSGLDITERKRDEEELRASRARIVEAADGARRRLERNLHDGAQQRLVALSIALRMAQARVGSSPAAAEQLLGAASDELSQALEELRELARGIHPAIVIDRGLPAALEALAGRAPVPVEIEIALDRRLPAQVEVAAYYVVSEALTNVAKYAQASAVTVAVRGENGVAEIEVADDGVGGADPGRGSGLRGLTDRVEALDGRLEIHSRPGSGTRVRASFPVRAEGLG